MKKSVFRIHYRWLFSIVMLVLTIIGVLIGWNQYHHSSQQAHNMASDRLAFIKKSLNQVLQTGDYDKVEGLFEDWGRFHPEIMNLELRAANGFLYAKYQRAQDSEYFLALTENINNQHQGKTTLFYQQDTTQSQVEFIKTILAITLALIIVYIFGVLLINRNRRLDLLSEEVNERNQAIQAEHSLLQAVIDSLPDLIYFKSTDGDYRGCNRQFKKFHGLKNIDVRGKKDQQLFDDKLARFTHERDNAIITSRHPVRGEAWQNSAQKKQVLMDTTHTPYFDKDGKLLGMIGIGRDITRLRQYQDNLEDLAFHDPLTGLPNRLYLTDHMQKDMSKAKRLNYKLAICAIDLDGFKPVNDRFGHEVGDQVLVKIASLLQSVLRQEDTVARWGGDEFTLLLNNMSKDASEINRTLRRIQEAINSPIDIIDDHTIRLSSSIGITIYPDDEQDADTLLRHADQAMYLSKQNGKNQYTFFDPEQDRSIHTQAEQLTHLMEAIEQDQLRLLYQPQINMKDGSLHGVEALVRWQHPQKGLISPADFLPPPDNQIANIALDNWVLLNALKQLEEWQSQNMVPLVSVNLSAASLQDPLFVSRLSELLHRFGNAAGHLQLEVLESTSMNDINKVANVIEKCMDMGVSFALDDFGTGYSSLTYLRRLPADTLKIDRSFVIDMLDDENDLIIVNGILRLAEAFNKNVIAEGVETIEHGTRLLDLGALYIQGYGIARPMPAAEITNWYTQYQLPDEWSSVRRATG